jgi:ribosomal protein L11 methyltransferase
MRVWYALDLRVPAAAVETVAALLWDYPLTGLEEDTEDPGHLVAFSDRPFDEETLGAAVRAWVARAAGTEAADAVAVRLFTIEDEDWMRLWKQGWRPTPLGRLLVAVPAWWEDAVPAGRQEVRIEPGRAFGTGTHLSTALAWELLEPCLPAGSGAWMLDVGAGSGLLSLGAASLDPGLRVLATELDPDALPSLRENLGLNPAGSRVRVARSNGVPCAPGRFALAVVNLTAAEHRGVDPALVPALAAGGRLVLSGLRDEQAAEAATRWEERRYVPEDRVARGGWTALRFRRV